MTCRECEERLAEWDALDGEDRACAAAHLDRCPDCRLRAEDIEALDDALAVHFSGIALPAGFAARVRAQTRRIPLMRPPSAMPEVLDFIGWAAVLAVAAVLWYSPAMAFLKG